VSRASQVAREQRDEAMSELEYQKAETQRLSAQLFELLERVELAK